MLCLEFHSKGNSLDAAITEMGYRALQELVVAEGRKVKAVIPGGSSVSIMPASDIEGKDVRMDYGGLVAAGSMVG